MFKKLTIGLLAAVLFVSTGAGAYIALAAKGDFAQQADPVEVVFSAETAVDSNTVLVNASLTADELDGMVFMFEEEKLARDVYNALFELWGHPIFQSIAGAEQKHMDAVGILLARYAVEIPSTIAGTFNDGELQSLYDGLMAAGSLSLADALKVGATIEEVDILDLMERMEKTDKADILWVYENLLNGSYNHLRSFTTVLERTSSEVYQPQYMDDSAYQEIISGTNRQGGSATFSSGQGATRDNGAYGGNGRRSSGGRGSGGGGR
ncbi:DUF2202 domain-containing protein [Chloroflexota bacterium]